MSVIGSKFLTRWVWPGTRIDSLEDIREMFLHEVCDDDLEAWDDGRSISIVRFTDHPVGSAVDLARPLMCV